MDRLGPLVEDFVFLGGCAVGLLLTDRAAPPVRATVDVDVITEVGSHPMHVARKSLTQSSVSAEALPNAAIAGLGGSLARVHSARQRFRASCR